jgi:two-component system, NtrC family, sensor kinase
MDKDRRPKITRKVLIAVSVTAALFLAAGLALGLWSARELREVVGDQFNEQQLVIARHVSVLIERQIQSLKKELLLLKEQFPDTGFDPEAVQEAVQRTFRRVLETGVWKIEVVDLQTRQGYTFMPFKHWASGDVPSGKLNLAPPHDEPAEDGVWVSGPQIEAHGISLFLWTTLREEASSSLIFNLNVSWFLNPLLGAIRSGKTGYAWLIDDKGRFLYHPNSDFIGKPAIEIREEAYQGIPLGMIAFIQREKMLQGQEGTGWFFSGWHRGITGKIKKLIAYSPVILSRNPYQMWSVAVVAPISEIDDSVQQAYLRQFFLQGLVILVILVGAGAVLVFEMKWSKTLEVRVTRRTEELKKSEEKYRSLVESAEDFIFTVDGEGCFQSMNSFTASFFGGRADEFLGKGLQTLFPEKVAQEQLSLVQLVLGAGKSVRDEFEIDLAGHKTWISANFMPLKNEQGEVSAVLCIARDITENKNLERQLINAEKLASIGTLAAGVAHEVNNPLGVILGFCDLLLRKKDKGSQEYEDLKTIERQGLHCKEVVENLLSFARLGEGDADHADVNQCIEDIVKVVRHTLEMHQIELELFMSEGLSPVQGDSRQLQQVFLNLITNAVSAMPSGGALRIRTYLERASRKAVIRIEDDGTGIKEEHMDRIFEPFFTNKPEGEGTGLGLFVSYGIITKFGGTIDCVSRVATPTTPGGTTFTIKLLTQT